jgi:putative glutamine amidotransferase
MAPLIGITTYGRNDEGRFTLPAEYVEAVRRAGGVPFLIPPGEERVDRVLEVLDGLILAGGGDIAPDAYGGAAHETIYNVNPDRDRLELALARRVLASGQPALGICRGLQVLNVALGGTLIEHLPDAVGEAVLHRAPPREPIPHPVRIRSGSRLAGILGGTEHQAVSSHHQAVRVLAPGLEAVAHAPDGVIEAVELPRHPWLIAVQWHPELAAAREPADQRLFAGLVEAARAAGEHGRQPTQATVPSGRSSHAT